MVTHDRSSERVRLCCWKIRFCTLAHEQKLGLGGPALRCLRDSYLQKMENTNERNQFNLQMNEQSSGLQGSERERKCAGHSPFIKLSSSNNNGRAIAFTRRPQTPIFMSTFYAHQFHSCHSSIVVHIKLLIFLSSSTSLELLQLKVHRKKNKKNY